MSPRRRADGPQDARPAQRADRLPGLVRRAVRWGVLGAAGCFLGWGLAATAAPASAAAAPSDCSNPVTSSVARTLDGVVSGIVHLDRGASAPSCRVSQHADPAGHGLLDSSDAVTDELVRPTTNELSRPLRPVTTQVGKLVDKTVDGMTDLQVPVGNAGTDALPVAVYHGTGVSEAPDGAAASHRRDGVVPGSRTTAADDAEAAGRATPVGGGQLLAGRSLSGDALPGDTGPHSVPTGPRSADNSPGSSSGAGGIGAQACTSSTTTVPATGLVRLAPSNDDELPSNAAGKPRVSPD